jgi:hypothetical protein
VLIQGDMKLIQGYPGWRNPSWDGWPTPPGFDGEDGTSDFNPDHFVPDAAAVLLHAANSNNNGSFCDPIPCLFNIATDPTEHTDVAAANPQIVAKMQARLLVSVLPPGTSTSVLPPRTSTGVLPPRTTTSTLPPLPQPNTRLPHYHRLVSHHLLWWFAR